MSCVTELRGNIKNDLAALTGLIAPGFTEQKVRRKCYAGLSVGRQLMTCVATMRLCDQMKNIWSGQTK